MATNIVNPAGPQLVLQNYFSLVQAIASKIKRRLPAHVDVEDLVQTGMIGLLEASSRFDSSRMVDFSSYANSRITGAILDELRKWDTCSRQDRKASREIEEAKSRLRAISGTEPAREQIAEAVGMGLADYERTLQRLESSKQPASHPDNQDSDFNDELAKIPSVDASPFELFIKREDFKVLKSYIERLKTKQRQVLELYYFQDLGLKEIGERMGVGEARISQIHKQAILELRRLISGTRWTQPAMVSALVQ